MEWSRPENIPCPNIWKKFKELRELNGKIPEFWIQDVPENQIETLTEIMQTGFVVEEPFCKYARAVEDPVSMAQGRQFYRHILSSKLSVVCMIKNLEGRDEIAGICCLERVSLDDPHVEVQGEVSQKFCNLKEHIYSVKDPFTHLGVTEFITDGGIYVLPQFRRQGICLEFLKTWKIICKKVGMKAVLGTFTSLASQKVANRAGFKELSSFSYVELGKLNPKLELPGIEQHTENLRLLYVTVE